MLGGGRDHALLLQLLFRNMAWLWFFRHWNQPNSGKCNHFRMHAHLRVFPGGHQRSSRQTRPPRLPGPPCILLARPTLHIHGHNRLVGLGDARSPGRFLHRQRTSLSNNPGDNNVILLYLWPGP